VTDTTATNDRTITFWSVPLPRQLPQSRNRFRGAGLIQPNRFKSLGEVGAGDANRMRDPNLGKSLSFCPRLFALWLATVMARLKKSLRSKEQTELLRMLKKARSGAKMTQETLAAKLGKPQSFVAKYEAGERRPDVVELIKILQAVGEPPSDFVDRLDRTIGKRG